MLIKTYEKKLSNIPLCNLLPSNTLLISNAKIQLFARTSKNCLHFIH